MFKDLFCGLSVFRISIIGVKRESKCLVTE